MQSIFRFRPVDNSDAGWIAEALRDEQVAMNTATIPHPLPAAFAETWVSDWKAMEARDQGFRIIGTTPDNQGFASAAVKRSSAFSGELSFWIAPRFWRQGLASLISRAAVDRAREIGFVKLTAGHFDDNAGSSSVLRKLDFRPLDQTVETFSLSRNKTVRTVRYELEIASE